MVSLMDLDVRDMFEANPCIVVPRDGGLLSAEQWERLRSLTLPETCAYEHYPRRDQSGTWMSVARFMIDMPVPERTMHREADEVVSLLLSTGIPRLCSALLGRDAVLRRVQAHIIPQGSSVGRHHDLLDNPDYKLSGFIVMEPSSEGGEFVCYSDGKRFEYPAPPGTLFLIRSTTEHEITEVLGSPRRSFVFFVSDSAAPNVTKPRPHLVTLKKATAET
jgi:hypothetical protein